LSQTIIYSLRVILPHITNWQYSHGSLKLIINGSGFALIKLANQNPVFGSGFAFTNLEPRDSNIENHLRMRVDATQTSSILLLSLNFEVE
jgi:hypothetical protein